MKKTTEKTKKEAEQKQQADLDPCVKPQSHESTRSDENDEACNDGVK
ncbi:MAG: hypothetical protein ABFC65_02480 [Rectinema sp.]